MRSDRSLNFFLSILQPTARYSIRPSSTINNINKIWRNAVEAVDTAERIAPARRDNRNAHKKKCSNATIFGECHYRIGLEFAAINVWICWCGERPNLLSIIIKFRRPKQFIWWWPVPVSISKGVVLILLFAKCMIYYRIHSFRPFVSLL